MKFSADRFFDLSQFEHASLFADVEQVWQVFPLLKSYLLSQRLGLIRTEIPAGAFIINPDTVAIGEGTIVEPGALIKGPCIIGKNCEVRHGAYIRENVLVGDHSVIGHASELKNAILLNHAHAAHFAYVGDSILGHHVNLGAGVKCANVRLDRGPVTIRYEDNTITTGLRKLGAIIGDRSQIGCNAVINPGTLIEKECYGLPNRTLSGVIIRGKSC
jgi:UDP-N-acetylglucosamine diphosphorylase / glucose-1-phosphate thymidylyltransferase / UDP-N-acetylgalactosamine diphosphorylase / glucosamine-1-phosphate N-acetyltransferase / galactosamine-1-phosphate N-acetyltransferase